MQGLVLALFGACVGSFTNVVAWRLPRQESVVVPGSHCPRCGHAVRWHDNLPIFGWLLLLGRCRDCRSPISSATPLLRLSVLGYGSVRPMCSPVGEVACPQQCCPGQGCH